MAKRLVSPSLECVRSMYTVANILALVPPYHDRSKSKLYKFYAVMMSVATGAFYVVYFSLRDNSGQNAIVAFLDTVSVTTVAVSLIFATFRSTLISVREKLAEMNNIFLEIDTTLHTHKVPFRVKLRFYIEVVLSHTFMIILYVYEAYIRIQIVGLNLYVTHLWHYFGHYCNMILVLLLYGYAKAIKDGFVKANENLRNAQIELTLRSRNNGYVTGMAGVKRVRKVHSQLTQLVDLFSDVFGWAMLFLSAIVLLGVLEVVNFVLVASLVQDFVDDPELKIGFEVIVYLWCIMLTIMGATIAATCDMTIGEAQSTANVCCSLLLDVPAGTINAEYKTYRDELVLLIKHSTHQCPNFTAAGFFKVDCKMLFGLLGTMTSYVILLIQINK